MVRLTITAVNHLTAMEAMYAPGDKVKLIDVLTWIK